MTRKQTDSLSRRRFLKAAAGTAAVTAGVAPGILGAAAREFKVGLIGCGGRGTGAARNAMSAGKMQGDNVVIHAVADLFSDKATRARRTFKVDESRMFVGFDAYKGLLETDCDYVILATPPHFRPAHLEAAVAAGKHVFTEKPVAVDPPGIRQFLAAGESAREKGLSIAAGTQRRHEKKYIECARRVADGAIGDIVAGRCYWNMGGLWSVKPNPDWTDMEWQIRDWLYFTWLSGDHIVEQHVHNLDVMNWFIGRHPKTARGMGGRQVRTGKIEYGQIFDHFATEVIYDNPKGPSHPDIRVSSMCRQIAGCWNDVSEFLVGTKGSTDCSERIYGAGPHDKADWRWRDQQVDPYVQEHIDLQSSIKEDKGALNETENVAHSTMTAILCRTSCYTGREAHWDELIASEERIGPTKYEFGPLEIPPVPQVGKPM